MQPACSSQNKTRSTLSTVSTTKISFWPPMNNQKIKHLYVSLLAFLCSIFTMCFLASSIGFDGVVIKGLTSSIGTVYRGRKFDQELTFYNLTCQTIHVTVRPMCGCAFKGPTTFLAGPLSCVSIHVPYRVRTGLGQQQSRKVFVDYDAGTIRQRKIATVSFFLSN